MRVIIKNADFSNVSLAKVYEKNLEFEYTSGAAIAQNLPFANVTDRTVALPWTAGLSSNISNTTFYIASSGDAQYTVYTNNNNRMVSDFIEVYEGMKITSKFIATSGTPFIICFDENQNLLGPSATYTQFVTSSSLKTREFTIPSGVKYIKFQFSKLYDYDSDYYIKAEFPTT